MGTVGITLKERCGALEMRWCDLGLQMAVALGPFSPFLLVSEHLILCREFKLESPWKWSW